MAIRKKTRRKITYSAITIILIVCVWVMVTNLNKFDFTSNIEVSNSNKVNSVEPVEVPKSNISIGLIDIDTFNPVITKNQDVVSFSKLVYDSLFEYTKNMELVPKLVDTYNYSDNTLYIKLLENVYWHNGEKLSSEDVKFTIDMIKQYGGIYSKCVENILSVELVDNYTLKFELADRTILTEYDLIFPIISYKYYQDEDYMNSDKNMQPMGTGMYKYLYSLDDKHYIFVYNDNSTVRAQIGQIDVYNFLGISEGFANIKNKKVDMIFTGLTNYSEYIGKIGYSKEEYIDNTYVFLGINMDNKYLSNINVRRAINIGIDKSSVFEDVYNKLGYVSQSVIYPHSYLYKNIDENYDIDQAKQLLIDVKLNNQVSVNLLVNKDNIADVKVAEKIKEQLEKISVMVNVIEKKKKEYLDMINTKEYDMVISNYGISNNINMKMFEEGQVYNLFNFDNEDFKGYIRDIKNMNSYDERKKLFDKIQKTILEQIPYIGIGFKVNTIIYSSDLLGVTDVRYNNYFINISEFNKK